LVDPSKKRAKQRARISRTAAAASAISDAQLLSNKNLGAGLKRMVTHQQSETNVIQVAAKMGRRRRIIHPSSQKKKKKKHKKQHKKKTKKWATITG